MRPDDGHLDDGDGGERAGRDDVAVCVVPLPGLQSLLMAAGLVRQLAAAYPVLLVADVEHERTLRRMFGCVRDVRFWFTREHAEERARALGLRVMVLRDDPMASYSAAGLEISHMHDAWWRDEERERRVLERVVDMVGNTFVVVQGRVGRSWLPEGVPTVPVDAIPFDDPLDVCGVLESAAQVHAPDGWLLTLADIVGGRSSKYCHAYASEAPLAACRRKYRRRVRMIT
mgnify:CR=1 FL=1